MVGLLVGCRSIPAAGNNADPVYAEYDREFQTFLAKANGRVGKEVIKVERLSDRFTVPQKLAIEGTHYEIGLILGHIGQEAQFGLPMLSDQSRPEPESHRALPENLSAAPRSNSGRR